MVINVGHQEGLLWPSPLLTQPLWGHQLTGWLKGTGVREGSWQLEAGPGEDLGSGGTDPDLTRG